MFLSSRPHLARYRSEAVLGKMKSFFAIMTFVSIFVAVALSLKIASRGTGAPANNPDSLGDFIEFAIAIISVSMFFVCAIGSAASIMLGWKVERRQTEDTRLKISQLENQVSELTAKINSGDV
jgi:hypothetical protein